MLPGSSARSPCARWMLGKGTPPTAPTLEASSGQGNDGRATFTQDTERMTCCPGRAPRRESSRSRKTQGGTTRRMRAILARVRTHGVPPSVLWNRQISLSPFKKGVFRRRAQRRVRRLRREFPAVVYGSGSRPVSDCARRAGSSGSAAARRPGKAAPRARVE